MSNGEWKKCSFRIENNFLVFMIFILIHSFRVDPRLFGHFKMGFKRQCNNDACNYLLNGKFTFRLSCFSNQSMISIGVFHGDRIKDTHPEKSSASVNHISLSILVKISCCVYNVLCI
jgi:hypothetical protein